MERAQCELRDLGDKLGKKRGKKLRSLRPLAKQLVHPQDSVLGALSRWPRTGLNVKNYEAMIKTAFHKEWWRFNKIFQVDADGTARVMKKPKRPLTSDEYTLMEYNFSLFFGLAIQLYEATLVSDDTPYDRYQEGDASAMSPQVLEDSTQPGQAADTLQEIPAVGRKGGPPLPNFLKN